MKQFRTRSIYVHVIAFVCMLVFMMSSSEKVSAAWEDEIEGAVGIKLDQYVEVGDNHSQAGWYNNTRYFQFTLTKPGKVEVSIKRERQNDGYYLDYEVCLYDKKGEYLYEKSSFSCTEAKESFWVGLKAGVYYLACYDWRGNYTEDMSVSVHLDTSKKYEQEPNGTAKKSTKMTLGENYYANSEGNEYDYYSVEFTKDKIYRITYTGEEHNPLANIYSSEDEDYNFFSKAEGYGYSDHNQFSYDYKATESGTHYIHFEGDAYEDGYYEYALSVQNVTCQVNGHKYSTKITKKATYTSTGTKVKTCSVCGNVKTETIPAIVGLKKNSKGVWWYYSGGKHDTSFTGLCKRNGSWFYVKKGVLDWNYTGLCKYNGSWFYVKKGVLDWSYTGLCKHNGSWFYVKKGVLDWSYTGFCKRGGSWFYVNKGIVDWSYTGLGKSGNNWFHAKNGVLDWSYTGLSRLGNGSNWFYVKNGVIDWSYTGLCKYKESWFYVKSGKLKEYTGLCKRGNSWYYIYLGMVDWGYTGLCYYNGENYYVEKGVLNWNYTGLCKSGSKYYYVKKGVVDYDSTGLISIGKNRYYIKNGFWNSSYTGVYKYGGTRYYLLNGVVYKDFVGEVYYNGKYWKVKNGILIS